VAQRLLCAEILLAFLRSLSFAHSFEVAPIPVSERHTTRRVGGFEVMLGPTRHQFDLGLSELSADEAYRTKLRQRFREMQAAKVPVVFSLMHLAVLSGVRWSRLRSIVVRERLKTDYHVYALRSLTLGLQLDKAPAYERHIRPAIATQSRELLLKLLNLDLQTHPPQAAILGVTLTAEAARPQTAQRGLFQAQLPEPDKLDILLARLRSITGDHNVGAAELCNSHRDDEVTMTSFRPSVLAVSSPPSKSSCLALRRFRPAQPVRVSLKNGTPSLLFWQGGRLDLAEVKGSWQSSGYWWDGRTWEADEWDAIVVQPLYALRLRYERAPKAWTVAGVYD
jgi:hypothetical protein